jgi:hypothetical protein
MTRTGYMAQGRWADGDGEWFDLDPLYDTEQQATAQLRMTLEWRLSHPKQHTRILAGTRIVKRTIVDEVCQ